MNPKEFREFLIKLLAEVPMINIVPFGDKGRIKLSFKTGEFNNKLLALVNSHKLHLTGQSGMMWEFEITLLEK